MQSTASDLPQGSARPRKLVSQACEACRKTKKKCDGNQPCSSCSRLASFCTYDPADRRRTQHRLSSKEIERLQEKEEAFDGLWNAILNGKEEFFLDKIRTGLSLSDLVPLISQASLSTSTASSPLDLRQKDSTTEDISLGRVQNKEPGGLIQADRPQLRQPTSDVLVFRTQNDFVASVRRYDNDGQLSWHPSLERLEDAGDAEIVFPGEQQTYEVLSELHPQHDSERVLVHGLGTRQTGLESNTEPSNVSPREVSSATRGATGRTIPEDNQTSPYFRTAPSHEWAQAFGNLPFTSAIATNHFPSRTQLAQTQMFRRPEWQIMPHSQTDTTALGKVYTKFYRIYTTNFDRPMCSPPQSAQALVDASLYFRARLPKDVINADSWASELQRTFGDEFTHTVKLACVFMLASYMRWLLQPCPETYAALPPMMRPTLRQRLMLHASAADLIPMASFRDILVQDMRDFVGACARAGLDVTWPLTLNEALIEVPHRNGNDNPADSQILISPHFAKHVSNPRNWVLGRSILKEFPELEANSDMTFHHDEHIFPQDRWLQSS